MKVTQKQVAEIAGVTRATVSYVLSGRAEELKITDAVVRRVREAAESIGYTPSHAARALVSGKSMALGLLVGGIEGPTVPFWSLIAEGVESAALEADYDVLLMSGKRDPGFAGLRYLREGRVDALIALGTPAGIATAEAWRQTAVPPVVVHFCSLQGLPRVDLDAAPGLQCAVAHLAELGHRQIIWIGPGHKEKRHGGDRFDTVHNSAREHGLNVSRLIARRPVEVRRAPVDVRIQAWATSVAQCLPDPVPGTAIMCWNDELAMGLYALLAQRGVRVPSDVSVIGFDNYRAAAALPPLSTVSFECHKLGAEATRLALRIVRGELKTSEVRSTVVRVPARFVPRCSTGRPPGGRP